MYKNKKINKKLFDAICGQFKNEMLFLKHFFQMLDLSQDNKNKISKFKWTPELLELYN